MTVITGQLGRMTYEEACAFVTLLGIPLKPSQGQGELTAAGEWVRSLPRWQFDEFVVVMDNVWPGPQRNQQFPVNVNGGRVEREVWDFSLPMGYTYTVTIDTWPKAWAYSIHRASQRQVTEAACGDT